MNLKAKLVAKLVGLSIALGTTALFAQPINAQTPSTPKRTFFCENYRENAYATTVRSTRTGQNIRLINWSSNYFTGAGFDNRSRCQVISDRFEEQYRNGNLRYITSGTMARQPVICTASTKGGPCVALLFTLKPDDDGNQVVRQIFAFRNLATVTPIEQSSYITPERVNGENGEVQMRDYVDVFTFIRLSDNRVTQP